MDESAQGPGTSALWLLLVFGGSPDGFLFGRTEVCPALRGGLHLLYEYPRIAIQQSPRYLLALLARLRRLSAGWATVRTIFSLLDLHDGWVQSPGRGPLLLEAALARNGIWAARDRIRFEGILRCPGLSAASQWAHHGGLVNLDVLGVAQERASPRCSARVAGPFLFFCWHHQAEQGVAQRGGARSWKIVASFYFHRSSCALRVRLRDRPGAGLGLGSHGPPPNVGRHYHGAVNRLSCQQFHGRGIFLSVFDVLFALLCAADLLGRK